MARSFYSNEQSIAQSELPVAVPQPVSSTEESLTTEFVEGHKVNRSGFLEQHTQQVRESLNQNLNIATAEYNNLKASANNEWNNLVENVTSVYDPRDRFLPNFNYALTVMLTGSILAAKKSLPVRFITPVVFGAAAFKLFLPRTFANTCDAVKNYEAEHSPQVLSFQRAVKASLQDVEQGVCQASTEANKQLIQLVHDVRVNLTK